MSISPIIPAADARWLRDNWGWFLALGIAFVILGLIALGATVATTVVSVVVLGALLLAGGVVEFVSIFSTRGAWAIVLRIALGLLFVFAGWSLITQPVIGALTLTLLMAIYFVIRGGVRIIMALVERMPNRGWVLLNGAVTLLLGILLWRQWPVSGLFAIGLFIAIDLLLGGISLIAGSIAARSAAPPSVAARAA